MKMLDFQIPTKQPNIPIINLFQHKTKQNLQPREYIVNIVTDQDIQTQNVVIKIRNVHHLCQNGSPRQHADDVRKRDISTSIVMEFDFCKNIAYIFLFNQTKI